MTPLLESIGGPLIGVVVGAFLTLKSTSLLDRQRRRLEKEYEIYADLWDKLFEMRRKISTLDPHDMGAGESMERIFDAFNAYKAVVRRNEPFIIASVYEPAQKILSLGRDIVGNHRSSEEIEKRRDGKDIGSDADQQLADKQLNLGDKIDKDVQEIEELMKAVLAAIRASIW